MKKIATASPYKYPRNQPMKALVLEHEAWKTLALLGQRAWPHVESPAVAIAVILAVLASLSVAVVVEAAAAILLTIAAALLLAAVFCFVVGLAFLMVHPAGNLILLFLLLARKLLRTPATVRSQPFHVPIREFV